MLRNNYFGETKTHYKLVKKGKAWVAIGVTTFSVGLSMFLTNYNVHADNTVVENESIDSGATDNETQTVMLKSSGAKNNDSILDETNEVSQAASATSAVDSQSSSSAAESSSANKDEHETAAISASTADNQSSSSAAKADTTSTSSSSAAKADTTSTSSSSAAKADTTSTSSSSAAKADTTSTSSSSAAKADTTSTSSSSAAKADTTSTSSSSAAKADTTSTSSSSAAKADTTSTSSSSAAKANTTSTSSSSAAKADVTIVKTKKSDKLISASSDEPTINVSRKTADSIIGGNALAISASVTIGQSQTIKAGTKIIISGLSSTYFDFSTAWGNGSESYGTYSADETSGQVIYTFTSDITNPGNLVMNWFITSKAVSTTTPITTINASYVDNENNSRVLTSTEFPNPNFTLTVNSPVPGQETRAQANGNNNGANLPVKNTMAYSSSGVAYFTPTQQYVMNTYILDPGALTNSQINRTYTISASGNGVRLSADFVSIALKNSSDVSYMSLAKAQAAGYLTYVVKGDGSIAITWTNGQSISFNRINVAIYAPDLSDTYTVTSTYTSDSGTAGLTVTTLLNKLAYVNSGTGFIPDITANDKTINVKDTIDDVKSWLLKDVTATDVEDGDLTSKIVISDDGGFTNAWNNKTPGKYKVTYSVADSNGNNVSSTVIITISAAAIVTKDSTLIAGPNTTWSAGDNFVSATDADGKALSLTDLKVSGSVDPTKAGRYEVTYSYTDAAGNAVTKTATITVVASQATIDTKDSTLMAGPKTKWSAGDNFVSATDADGKALSLTDLKVSGSVDPTKAGRYEVTYSYTDAAGNVISKTATITVVASKAAIDTKDSTLVAGPNTTWSAGDNFVSATDADGKALSLTDLKVSGSVDPTKAGRYEVTYSYTDAAGNAVTKTATITVVASQATIDTKDSTLMAGPKTKWSAGDNFVSATDADGKALSLTDLKVSGSVDPTKAGRYEVTYSYTDAAGNVISKTATITVVASKAAIDTKDSTLVAGPNTTWSAGDNFVSATDADGKALSLTDLKVSGSVDPTKAGRYEVTYSYTDAAGNAVTKTATITVVASQATIDTKDSTLMAGPKTKWSAGDNFVSATDADGKALSLTDLKVSGSVDPTKAGRYEVTYSYTDAAGNVISKTATITVVASKAAIDTKDSTLVAGPNTTWSAGDNFVSATDADGKALSLTDLKVSGSVDPTKAGRYEVTYSYTDAAGNAVTKTATITVVASQATIDTKDSTLMAGPKTKWSAGDNFVSATDADGKALSLTDLKVSGSVDPTKAGRYEVTYSYTDAAGNVISKTATITVVASKAAIDTKDSTLVAGPNTTWSAGDNFVSATDADGKALSLTDLKVSGSVDPTKAGRYEVTYSYTDAAGNVVTKTATITVIVKSDPVKPGKPSQPAKPVSPVTPDQTNQSAKSDQSEKSDYPTTSSQVTSVKSGSASQTTTSHNELPQTDESTQRTMTLGGLLLLVMTSLLTFLGGKKRRNQD